MLARTGEKLYEPGADWREPYDVLIIGSGPVGLALASELNDSKARVVVVESGGLYQETTSDDLSLFESVGAERVLEPTSLGARAFGGTSNIWSGRCAPFDDIDFEARPWVPFSGWPIKAATVAPFLDRASRYLGLVPSSYDDRLLSSGRRKARLAFDSDALRSQFWQYSQDADNKRQFARFGANFVRRSAANVHVILHATVTRLRFSADGASTSADVVRSSGEPMSLHAKHVVLCAGGIQNARLLLCSVPMEADHPLARAPVGRFLMDHPRATIGAFDGPSADAVRSTLGLYKVRGREGTRFFTHGMALSPRVQRRDRLLNCAAWLSEMRAKDDPWAAMKDLGGRGGARLRNMRHIVSNLPCVVKGATQYAWHGRGVLHKCDQVLLECLVEQSPDPNSRVSLSDRRDTLGMPRARIDWRISDLEGRTIRRFTNLIIDEFKRLGLPQPEISEGILDGDTSSMRLRDVAHPTGTTRMAEDSRVGVVDQNCRVHGMRGLYVAGSSVFPTGSHANPTLMAVALAIRLADHLKRVMVLEPGSSS